MHLCSLPMLSLGYSDTATQIKLDSNISVLPSLSALPLAVDGWNLIASVKAKNRMMCTETALACCCKGQKRVYGPQKAETQCLLFWQSQKAAGWELSSTLIFTLSTFKCSMSQFHHVQNTDDNFSAVWFWRPLWEVYGTRYRNVQTADKKRKLFTHLQWRQTGSNSVVFLLERLLTQYFIK